MKYVIKAETEEGICIEVDINIKKGVPMDECLKKLEQGQPDSFSYSDFAKKIYLPDSVKIKKMKVLLVDGKKIIKSKSISNSDKE